MHEGRVLYADHDHVHVLRYIGDVRHPLAPSISGFVDSLLERAPVGDWVLDLSEAEAIDSTNLGEMARIAERLFARGGRKVAIVSPRAEINQVLFSMAFDEVFDICTEAGMAGGGVPIPDIGASEQVALRVILDAHRKLMQMSESNHEQFSEVVELMERELAASTNGNGSRKA